MRIHCIQQHFCGNATTQNDYNITMVSIQHLVCEIVYDNLPKLSHFLNACVSVGLSFLSQLQ